MRRTVRMSRWLVLVMFVLAGTAVCGGGSEESTDDTLVIETEDGGGADVIADVDGSDAGREPDGGATVSDADGSRPDVGDGNSSDGESYGRRRVVIQGLDSSTSTWTVEASEDIHAREIEEGDTAEERQATGVVEEPLERDVVYVWGRLETLEVDGTARVTVDGEIRRNGPKTIEEEPPGDGVPIQMSIRLSVKLLERNGRIGPRMVARYAGRAFEEAGYGYELTYNLLPVEPPDEKSNCSAGDTPQWWERRVETGAVEPLGKDANVLMVDANGGGCAGVGRNYGTTPGRHIDEQRAHREIAVGNNDWQRNMHGTLHEIGHQLGARHDHEWGVDGKQHWGAGWVEETDDGEIWWHRTPNTAGNGAPNYCGTDIEKRLRDEETGVKRHQLYNDCAADNFEVVEESE